MASRSAELDDEVKRRRKALTDDGGGKAVKLYEPEPWPDPVDGETMADAIAATIHRTVVLATEAADAATLWTIFTHVHDAARFSPILGIVSPSPECGKTTLLSTIGLMVPKPLWANNITAAAVFRSVERWQPTLLIDEADSFLKDNEELRGVLNSGHNRDAAFVIRTTGDDHEPRQFRDMVPEGDRSDRQAAADADLTRDPDRAAPPRRQRDTSRRSTTSATTP